MSERFSNTAQFSDNLTKVYKSHAFKGGYMYQNIFFGSTQPPYARGEYSWDGRYTSLVNRPTTAPDGANLLLNQIPSLVPGGVDFLGGLNELRASPFGAVDAFKTYHGAYVQDSWHASSKLSVNYGLRWDWFSREQEREVGTGQHGDRIAVAVPDSGRLEEQAAVAELRQQPGEGWHPAGLHGRVRQRSRQDAEEQLRAARRCRLRDRPKVVLRSGYGLFYGAFENRGGNPSLGYNYPFQFTLVYQSPNDTAPNRLPDGSLVGLDARDRVSLDPVIVNANGLTLRGVEFDYKTPRYHNYNVTLQTESCRTTRSRSDTSARGDAPRNVHRHEQRHAAAAAGHQPAAVRALARLRARLAATSGRSA